MKKAWFSFSEVKQTWLGFSLSGNAGCGMGSDFANNLFEGLNSIFKNFGKQVEVYKAASETNRAIKVILYFSEKEYEKLCIILNDLGLAKCEDIILIDARDDNKESASNVKITAQSISGCQSQGDFKY